MNSYRLFDPEIGRERYLKTFDPAMGGISSWKNGKLQISGNQARRAFSDLREFHDRECAIDSSGAREWDYLILAPHIDADKGLLGTQQAQVPELFDHEAIAGLELGANKLRLPDLGAGCGSQRNPNFLNSGRYWLFQTVSHRSTRLITDNII